MRKYRKKAGLDEWAVTVDVTSFLQVVKQEEIEVYDIQIANESITFYAHIWQRHQLHRAFPYGTQKRTTGMLGYSLHKMHRPFYVLSLFVVCVLWYLLSHTCFGIEIKGGTQDDRAMLKKSLVQMGYTPPFYGKNEQGMKQALRTRLKNEIAWIEVVKQGSRYTIRFTPKQFVSQSTVSNKELVAQEDGVIARFVVEHGFKQKQVNEYVHAGDVLVSNTLEDSKGVTQDVMVQGRVYAYVWRDITVTMHATKLPKSFQYFELLMEGRRKVTQDFHQKDTIYKENILQFSHDMGKIKMVIHYTLYKDITTP